MCVHVYSSKKTIQWQFFLSFCCSFRRLSFNWKNMKQIFIMRFIRSIDTEMKLILSFEVEWVYGERKSLGEKSFFGKTFESKFIIVEDKFDLLIEKFTTFQKNSHNLWFPLNLMKFVKSLLIFQNLKREAGKILSWKLVKKLVNEIFHSIWSDKASVH